MKSRIPEGYTEEKVTEIIQKISERVSRAFTLGYMSQEDIQQECFILGWTGLVKYNGKHPLEHFMYVHIRYRFLNIIRKIKRREPPCYTCHAAYLEPTLYIPDHPDKQLCKKYLAWIQRNISKLSLMNAASLVDYDGEDSCESESVCPEFSKHIYSLLKTELDEEGRILLDKLLQGKRIKKNTLEKLIDKCKVIVDSKGIKWEELNGYTSA